MDEPTTTAAGGLLAKGLAADRGADAAARVFGRDVMRAVQMTPAQQRAQDASVRNLERVMREAEAYLSARADAAARDRLFPCGIALRSCQCPLRQAKSTTEVT